jgi:HlyD family secretion protein
VVQYPLRITEPTELRPATRSEVRASVGGVITILRKHEGDPVAAGDSVVELDTTDAQSKIDILEAQQGELVAQLEKLRSGSRPEEIKRAEEVVSARRVAREFSRQKLAREEQLLANKLASQDEREAARFDVNIKTKEVANAQAELDLVRAGARTEDVQAKEAELERVRAELKFARDELTRKVVRSSISGVLMTPPGDEMLGRAVHQGDLVAEVAQLERMRAEVLVPESEIGEVTIGQPVFLKVASLSGVSFSGKVAFIPSTAVFVEESQTNVVRVAVFIDNPELLLRDKMTGWAEIDCGERSLLRLSLRRIWRWARVRFLI